MSELEKIEEIRRVLLDKNQGVEARIQNLFSAKHYACEEAVHAVASLLRDESVLLSHEAAYVLGQMQLECAVPYLTEILEDTTVHSMTRHEAAEGLAAIGKPESIEIVKKYLTDDSAAVRETCYLALRSLQKKNSEGQYSTDNFDYGTSNYRTIDPVASVKSELSDASVEKLQEILMDEKEDLYKRYVALFQLRSQTDSNPQAVIALMGALKDKSSSLFRHEIAFVLGQIQTKESINPLVECLENEEEDSMARHEAAIALGSVISVHNESHEAEAAKEKLRLYAQHANRIVAESCLVALDTIRQECMCS